METLFNLIVSVVAFDIASLRWGYDSTEKIDNPEWERGATWRVPESGDNSRHEMPEEREGQ